MKKVTFFAAAAAATALIASPVVAQESVKPLGQTQTKQMKVQKSEKRMKSSTRAHSHRHHADRLDMRRDRMSSQDRGWNSAGWNDRGWDNNRSSGFWPADVVGGAVGTAGAIASGAANTADSIATAPFGGPYREGYRESYAFAGQDVGYNYDGIAYPTSSNYAARNGFVCQPGTITRAKNGSGVAVICQ